MASLDISVSVHLDNPQIEVRHRAGSETVRVEIDGRSGTYPSIGLYVYSLADAEALVTAAQEAVGIFNKLQG